MSKDKNEGKAEVEKTPREKIDQNAEVQVVVKVEGRDDRTFTGGRKKATSAARRYIRGLGLSVTKNDSTVSWNGTECTMNIGGTPAEKPEKPAKAPKKSNKKADAPAENKAGDEEAEGVPADW